MTGNKWQDKEYVRYTGYPGGQRFATPTEWLKKNPTRASFGTTAMGSFTHFFGVMTGQAIGVPLEPVPYRGAAPLVADLQGGHIAAGCGGITDFLEHHRAGKVRVLFTSGAKRTTAAPDPSPERRQGFCSSAVYAQFGKTRFCNNAEGQYDHISEGIRPLRGDRRGRAFRRYGLRGQSQCRRGF